MISLHAGRLLLVCSCSSRNWWAHVVLGPRPELQIKADTGTVHLPDALIRAQSVYKMAVASMRPADAPRCEMFQPCRANG
jgi:hypothetical protein